MSLLEQSAWWLVPYGLLMLFMVHAMVEFTLGLLVEQPYANRMPLPARELKQRLLNHNLPDRPYRLVEGEEGELELHWEVVDDANLLIIAGISTIRWGAWGILTWAIAGFPLLRRRPRRKAK